MSFGQETSRCPKCKETILVGAIICKHCQSEIKPPKTGLQTKLNKYDKFRTGFLAGILFIMILITLTAMYLYTDL